LDKFGMRDLFAHHTGHGIGFRYHEAIPSVHPDSTGVLQAGMITSLEPGLYGETFGYRVEDNVLITSTGAEPLCHSPRWPGLEP
jgi:Xaa-Pro aminopeptidase